MATNLQRKSRGVKTPRDLKTTEAKALAIGETNVRVFNCPSCARPLAEGTWRCSGCGVRLVMGVKLRRALGILTLGIVLGVPLGVVATASAVSLSLPGPPAVVVAQPSATPAPPSAAPSPSAPVTINVPQSAISALSGTAVVNGRITVDAATLSKTLANKGATPIEIARALRSLAADATLGIDLAGRLSPWWDAAVVQGRLEDFYQGIAQTAHTGLRASLADAAAYRKAGTDMVRILADLDKVDAASRALASTVDLELPPIHPGSE